jgi:membrane protein DedA with SNARE-associated domain
MQHALAISVVRPRRLLVILAAVGFASLLAWAAATSGVGVSLALATFISEDLTCITTGHLIRDGRVAWQTGLAGCFLGIVVGDMGLWLLGRLGGATLFRSSHKLNEMSRWLDAHLPYAVLASRFLPGTRLPMYLAAGALGRNPARFALWTCIAAAMWTPLVIFLVASLGQAIVRPLHAYLGGGWTAWLLAVLVGFLLIRFPAHVLTPIRRAKLLATVSRIWRWEFWPSWLFYLPLVPWIGYLSIRHRGFATITAANPSIPDGGFVGESKSAILAMLPAPRVIAFAVIPPGGDRAATLQRIMAYRGWHFPIILKPDVGQRGAGVRLARSREDADRYLSGFPAAVVAQVFHPGPYEAGVFCYRIPGQPNGRIFSITDKHFPSITGDGVSTLEHLVWRHPRYRMQASRFLTRHAADRDRILEPSERFALAIAGNHCQGTLFRDGDRLLTPELERAVDDVLGQVEGFYFGRLDVRYADPAAFKAGRDFAIVELNGVTSESTNVYDPDRGLLQAYRTLCRQWSLLFRIAAANRTAGHVPTPTLALLKTIVAYYRAPRPDALAD